jgi:hypothetical protein
MKSDTRKWDAPSAVLIPSHLAQLNKLPFEIGMDNVDSHAGRDAFS